MPHDNAFALKGNICYSRGPNELATYPAGFVICENGVSKGAYPVLPTRFSGIPVHDFGDALILPGLVDLHVHAPQYAYRTQGLDLQLLDWLDTLTFPEEARYRDPAYAAPHYDAFTQALLRGPNTRAVVFATAHTDSTLYLMDRLEESGLVTLVGRVNMDRNCPDTLREPDAAHSLFETERWLSACKGRYGHTRPILTPRFIPSCTDELMRGLSAIARRDGLPLQSHISENMAECQWVRGLCPDANGYGDAYAKRGLFGDGIPTIMAHAVHSDEAEIALMRGRGVTVAHCPQSNTNLASGVAPVRRMLDMGVTVGLGSDVAGGCHTSIFRAMSDAIQASKLRWRLQDDTLAPLTLPEAFHMATVAGGSFFGNVGSFDAGYQFDAIAVSDPGPDAPKAYTVEERLARAVYLSGDMHIQAKYVDGRRILGAPAIL